MVIYKSAKMAKYNHGLDLISQPISTNNKHKIIEEIAPPITIQGLK